MRADIGVSRRRCSAKGEGQNCKKCEEAVLFLKKKN
jgi:hypothetical protein